MSRESVNVCFGPGEVATSASANLAVFAERAHGADLVEPHEPRVASNVSRDYGCEAASDTGWLVLLHQQSALILAIPQGAMA